MELYREMALCASSMRFASTGIDDSVAYGLLREYLGRQLSGAEIPADNLFFHDSIVFVHSEAEAVGFPDHVLVAWPPEYAEGILVGIYWAVDKDEEELAKMLPSFRRDVIHLEDFGLSYPLTVADLVDNWEKVYALWSSLTQTEQGSIRRAAPYGGRSASLEGTGPFATDDE